MDEKHFAEIDRANNREYWWRFERFRPAMRDALVGLDRYVAANAQGKRILFPPATCASCTMRSTRQLRRPTAGPRRAAHDPQESNRLLLELNRAIAAGEVDYRPFATKAE